MLSDKPPKIKLDISRKPMVDSIQNRKPLCIKRRPHKILVREASDAIQYGSSIYELTKYARSHRIPVEGRYDHLYFRIQQLLQGSSITSAYRRICDTFTKYFLYTTGQRLGNIPSVFIFCFEETSQNGGWYGFDIRSLYEFYASDANFINPYTCQPINNRITTDLIKKIRWVQKLGFPIRHQSQALTVQDAFCLRVITAFQKKWEEENPRRKEQEKSIGSLIIKSMEREKRYKNKPQGTKLGNTFKKEENGKGK